MLQPRDAVKFLLLRILKTCEQLEGTRRIKIIVDYMEGSNPTNLVKGNNKKKTASLDVESKCFSKEMAYVSEVVSTTDGNKSNHKRTSSTSDVQVDSEEKGSNFDGIQRLLISEDFYNPDFASLGVQQKTNDLSCSVVRAVGSHFPKLKCRVIGAYFEKIGSKSFAVYLVVVTDALNNQWFVKRRYKNFERLHRQLKDIPNSRTKKLQQAAAEHQIDIYIVIE